MEVTILVNGLQMGLFYVGTGKYSFGCTNNTLINKLQAKLISGSILFTNLKYMMIIMEYKANGFT
jgi:hypothetical protein